jgi:hypothetical protein
MLEEIDFEGFDLIGLQQNVEIKKIPFMVLWLLIV